MRGGGSMAVTGNQDGEMNVSDVSKTGEEFLGLLSHELRAPLTVISGYAQLLGRKLGRKGLSDEVVYADLIKEQTSRMARMVTDLVELGRLESGAFELERQPVVIKELISRVLMRVNGEHQVSRASHEVICSVEPEGLKVWADSRRLDQVLTNLLANAVRYSPDGKLVSVSARLEPQAGEVRVSVTDSGVGVPSDERAHIFERCFRGVQGRKLAAQGLGLGLYVSRRIVEAHGGAMGV